MTKKEFDARKAELEKKFEEDKIKLSNEYAISNNRFNKSDVIRYIETKEVMIINNISIIIYKNDYPVMRYDGTRLKNDLTPYKKAPKCYMYSSWPLELVKKNGEKNHLNI